MEKSTWYGLAIFLVIIVAGFIFLNPSNATVNSNVIDSGVIQGTTQKVILSMKNSNYYPDTIKVKAGEPVSISLDSSVTGCLRSFNIKDLGVSKNARTPQETIDFTPTKKGTFAFMCSMGMGRGTIIVE